MRVEWEQKLQEIEEMKAEIASMDGDLRNASDENGMLYVDIQHLEEQVAVLSKENARLEEINGRLMAEVEKVRKQLKHTAEVCIELSGLTAERSAHKWFTETTGDPHERMKTMMDEWRVAHCAVGDERARRAAELYNLMDDGSCDCERCHD